MRGAYVCTAGGIFLLFGAAGVWATTGRESVLMMMSGVILVAIGAFQAVDVPDLKRIPERDPREPAP